MDIFLAFTGGAILLLVALISFSLKIFNPSILSLAYGATGGLLIGITLLDWLPAGIAFHNLPTVMFGMLGGAAGTLLLDTITQFKVKPGPAKRLFSASLALVMALFVFYFVEGLYLSVYLVPETLLPSIIKIALNSLLFGFVLGTTFGALQTSFLKLTLIGLGAGILLVTGTTLTLLIPLIPAIVFSLSLSIATGTVWYTVLTTILPTGLKHRRWLTLASTLISFTLLSVLR